MIDKELIDFAKTQKVLSISTIDENSKPWISNVYFSCDQECNLFFVGPTFTNRSQHIENNEEIAFTTVWYDQNDLTNRKAIQGKGICQRITEPSLIIKFLKNHAKYYPLWKDVITHENMVNKIIRSKPYIIKPTYLKFWNDELYGEEGTKEFNIVIK